MTIDLNCDMGEGIGADEAIMPFISSANIACGYHAGNQDVILKTIELCLRHNVAVGAHPGFPDKSNFGRTPMHLSSDELCNVIWAQLEIMQTCCDIMNAVLDHVKPHGAMYSMAAKDTGMSATIAQAVKEFNPKLFYYGLSGSCMIEEAKKIKLYSVNEVFADRTYHRDGSLTSRTEKNALIENPETALNQVLDMIRSGKVTATDGSALPIVAESVCVHGDGKNALSIVQRLNTGLQKNGISIQRPMFT